MRAPFSAIEPLSERVSIAMRGALGERRLARFDHRRGRRSARAGLRGRAELGKRRLPLLLLGELMLLLHLRLEIEVIVDANEDQRQRDGHEPVLGMLGHGSFEA